VVVCPTEVAFPFHVRQLANTSCDDDGVGNELALPVGRHAESTKSRAADVAANHAKR
jgi:hypothetical protein